MNQFRNRRINRRIADLGDAGRMRDPKPLHQLEDHGGMVPAARRLVAGQPMGIDPHTTIHDLSRRPLALVEGSPVRELLA